MRLYEAVTDTGAGGGGSGTADDPVKAAAYERDTARAEAAKLKREIDDLKKKLPTDEERQKWAEAEKAQQTAEEERKRKAGEFDSWRVTITDQHAKELDAEKSRATKVEQELQDTLIGLEFAGASDLFSPTGKTVLLPKVAQAYFRSHVAVEQDEATGSRRVVVKDAHGNTVIDAKTGRPMEFGRAMKELIDSHPDRDHLLRGSGKVGSGSAGGGTGTDRDLQVDVANLTPEQRRDPKILDALRARRVRGGMVIGQAYQK